jgi:hypothetical protein
MLSPKISRLPIVLSKNNKLNSPFKIEGFKLAATGRLTVSEETVLLNLMRA